MQPWHIPFPIWNQSIVPCSVLTIASWPAYRFLMRQIRWSDNPISFRIFHSLLWSTQSKALAVNKAEIDVLLELLLFWWLNGYWQFDLVPLPFLNSAWIFGSSQFMDCGSLAWRILNITSMWDEYNCAVVWTFFGIAFLWDWNENWPFLVLWPLLSFPNLLAYWLQHLNSIIFQDVK